MSPEDIKRMIAQSKHEKGMVEHVEDDDFDTVCPECGTEIMLFSDCPECSEEEGMDPLWFELIGQYAGYEPESKVAEPPWGSKGRYIYDAEGKKIAIFSDRDGQGAENAAFVARKINEFFGFER